MNHLSLFSGIGGLDLAAHWAGFRAIAFVERDEYCQRILAKHWPGVPIYGDVAEISASSRLLLSQIEEHEGKRKLRDVGSRTGKRVYPLELLTGGFPCQPHSVAGKRKASGDERDLWGECARITGEFKPRWAVFENVPGLLSSEGGSFFAGILGDLAALGYRVGWGVWGANDVGALHKRDRVFVVARSVADAKCSGRPGQGESVNASDSAPPSERETTQSWNGSGRQIWSVEPGVGRTFDGFPSWLYRHCGRGMSYAESERGVEALRSLWSPDVAKALWASVGGHGRIQQAEVLFSVVRELKKRTETDNLALAGEEAQEIALRVMRGTEKSPCSPHRPEPIKQRSGELADALQVVPQLFSRDGEAPWHRSSWEDGIPRVASGVKHRVDRLRALGNAVVPQQAYPLFKAIAEIELNHP